MIRNDTVLAVTQLVKSLDNKHKSVVARQGSLLSQMTRVTNDALDLPDFDSSVSNETSLDYHASAIAIATGYNEPSGKLHTDQLDGFVSEISKAVMTHFDFARNVVTPMIIEMASELNRRMSLDQNDVIDFTVRVKDIPEFLDEEARENILKEKTLDGDVSQYLVFNDKTPLTPETALTFLSTGAPSVDTAIAVWFSKVDFAYLQEVFSVAFQGNVGDEEKEVGTLVKYLSDRQNGVDASIFIYLLTRRFYDDVQSTDGLNLDRYHVVMDEYRALAVRFIVDAIRSEVNFINSKRLIISFDQIKKEIVVCGPVYNEFIKEHDTEAMFGSVIKSVPYFNLNEIVDHQQELIEGWDNYRAFDLAARQNKKFSNFRYNVTMAFKKATAGYEEDTALAPQVKIEELLQKEVDDLVSSDMDDINLLSTKVISRARFFYTDCEKILLDMQEAKKTSPSISGREAATIALINYVADYLADQIEIVSA